MIEVIRSRKFPVEAALTRKAGSKFLMNLFYQMDRGKRYPHPEDIESSSYLRWSNVHNLEHSPEEKIERFAIVRNPLTRFADFYFDKIYYQSPQCWVTWREALRKKKFDFEAEGELSAHQANAHLVVDMIEDKIARHGLYNLPAQIIPQVSVIVPAQDFGFHSISYARIQTDLPPILSPFVKNIDKKIARLQDEITPRYPFDGFDFTNGTLAKRLRSIYAIDFDFFEGVSEGTA